jgi:adenylate cyclase
MLGDGAMLAFGTRSDAIAATGALVHEHPEVPVCRAGIATGPVLARNGDYFGPVVNLASRLSGAVGAGEMAVDDSQTLDGDSRVETVTLKGIDEPVSYYRLAAHG